MEDQNLGYDSLEEEQPISGYPDLEDTAAWEYIKQPANEVAAREYGAKLGIGVGDQEAGTAVGEEFIATGTSETRRNIIQLAQANQRKAVSEALVQFVQENPDSKEAAVEEARKRFTHELSTDELAAQGYGILAPSKVDSEIITKALSDNALQVEMFNEELRKAKQSVTTGFGLKGAANLAGTFIPFVDSDTVRDTELALVDEFPEFDSEEFQNGTSSFLANGSGRARMRDIILTMKPNRQREVLKYTMKVLNEQSGLFSANQLEMSAFLDDVFNMDHIESDMVDMAKVGNNIISALEFTGLVKGIARTGKVFSDAASIRTNSKVMAGADRNNSAEMIKKVDPNAAEKVIGAAHADPSGVRHAETGRTPVQAVQDDLLPKDPVDIGKMPNTSSDSILRGTERSIREQELIRKAVKDVEDMIPDNGTMLRAEEKVALADNLIKKIDEVAGSKIWKNATTVKNVEDGYNEVSTIVARTETSLMTAIQAEKQLPKFKTLYGDMGTVQIRAVTKSGEITAPLKQIATVSGKPKIDLTASGNVSKELESIRKSKQATLNSVINSGDERLIAKAQKQLDIANDDKLKLKEGKLGELSADAQAILKDPRIHVSDSDRVGVAATKSGDDIKGYVVEIKTKESFKEVSGQVTMPKAGESVEPVRTFNRAQRHLADMAAALPKEISGYFTSAYDQSQRTVKILEDLGSGLTKAKRVPRRLALQWLDEGDRTGKAFSIEELMARSPDSLNSKVIQEAIVAYRSGRDAMDAAFVLADNAFRRDLLNQGFNKHAKVGDWEMIVKPLAKGDDVKMAWNPSTGQMVDTTKPNSTEGYRLAVTREPVGSSEVVKANHILIKDSDLKMLPENVLSYRQGYVPRTNKENFFITIRPNSMNLDGKDLEPNAIPTKAIHVARNKIEAERFVEGLQKDYPEHTISYKLDKPLDDVGRITDTFNVEELTGGLFYSKRGDDLTHMDGTRAELQDVMGSFQNGIQSVAAKVNFAPVLETNKRRWMNSYGEEYGLKHGVTNEIMFPRDIKDITSQTGRGMTDARLDEARTAWHYINNLELTDPTYSAFKKVWFRLGETMSRAGLDKAGNYVAKIEFNPVSFTKGATFTNMIALNPIRQLWIQSQQIFFLSGMEHGLKHIMTGSAHRQGTALLLRNMTDTDYGIKTAAKASGMALEDYKMMEKSFKNSGLMQSIDSNLMGRDAVMQMRAANEGSALTDIGEIGYETYRSTVNGIRKVGFDVGERAALSTTFSLAWKRGLKKAETDPKHPKVGSKDFDRLVHEDARQLALSMNKPGGFAYQKGWASLGTQFLSVQNKAVLAMNPTKVGPYNRHFTQKERINTLLTQTAFYGSAGIGLHEGVQATAEALGVTLSPDVALAVEGGIFDYAVKTGVELAGGEPGEHNFQVSKHQAAGSGAGNFMVDVVDHAFNDGIHTVGMGASWNMVGRVGRVYNAANVMFQSTSAGEFQEPDARKFIETFASMSSGFANFNSGQATMSTGKYFNSKMQQLDVDATKLHGLFKTMGITDRSLDAQYGLWNSIKEKKEELRDSAKVYEEHIRRHMLNSEDAISNIEKLEELARMGRVIDARYENAEDAATIKEITMKNLRRDPDFMNQIMRLAENGNAGSIEEFLKEGYTSGRIPKEEYDAGMHIYGYATGDNEYGKETKE